jgi:SNF2 family DNA or RNA helicase
MPDFASVAELAKYHGFPFDLRHDQVEDVENNVGYTRVALFNEVGTGKTATGTALALGWDQPHNLVLVPPVLLRQWYNWLSSLHDVGRVAVYAGDPSKRQAIDLRAYRWLLMTIQIFKNDYTKLSRAFVGEGVATVVDEAHCIKNISSANHKRVRDFSQGRHLLLMTGTPVAFPGDAYAYIRLKTPGVYRSQAHFEGVHVGKRDFFGNVQEWQNLDLLNQNLMLQASRRLSSVVLKHLKQPNYIPIHYDLAPEHLALYKQLADEQLLLLPDGAKIDATSAGRLYNALQQVVCNWSHFSGEPGHRSRAFDLVDAVCDEIDVKVTSSSKLIIYTYYVMTSRALVEHLKPKGLGVVACYSEVSAKEQAEAVRRFLEDQDCRVLVAQPGSAGVGWNAQHVCWEALFLEEPVSPTPFVQAVGRIARDGQRRVPNIRLAIAESTIQVRLHGNLLVKDHLANKVQGGFQDLRDAIHGK